MPIEPGTAGVTSEGSPSGPAAPSLVHRSRSAPGRTAVTSLFVVSGAAGLMYQVVWSRQLVLVFGSTSQAVTTIVTAFMIGLGFGGLAGGRWAHRTRRPLRRYAGVELGIATLAVAMPLVFSAYGTVYGHWYTSLVDHPLVLTMVRLGLALLSISPAAFLMGMTLPLVTQYVTRSLHLMRRRTCTIPMVASSTVTAATTCG